VIVNGEVVLKDNALTAAGPELRYADPVMWRLAVLPKLRIAVFNNKRDAWGCVPTGKWNTGFAEPASTICL
jgi:hypothetical protein